MCFPSSSCTLCAALPLCSRDRRARRVSPHSAAFPPLSRAPVSKRVFVLGPSHHWYTKRCAISGAAAYETPVGNLPVDQQSAPPQHRAPPLRLPPHSTATTRALTANSCRTRDPPAPAYDELRATGLFDVMPLDVDEAEHSMEMEMPYVRLIFAGREDVAIVPILVGALTTDSEAQYGAAQDAGLQCLSRVGRARVLSGHDAQGGSWAATWTTRRTSSSSPPTSATGAQRRG